jgi:hypothetical protein
MVGDLELEGDLPVSGQSKWMKDLEIYQKAVFSNLNPLMVSRDRSSALAFEFKPLTLVAYVPCRPAIQP